MNPMHVNGRKRPTLSDQIVRLDHILDGLAENLNEAVADAVKEAVSGAVKEAIQAILKEVLTNQDLLATLNPEPAKAEAGAGSSTTEKRPGLWERLAGRVKVACQKVESMGKVMISKAGGLIKHGYVKVATMAGSGLKSISTTGASVYSRVKKGVTGTWTFLQVAGLLAVQFRKPLLIALAIGSGLGVVCYWSGPVVASTISGLAGFAVSLVGSAANAFRRMLTSVEVEKHLVN